MSRLDHSRINARDRMRRQGMDSINADGIPASLAPPKQRPSKAAMRAELAGAVAKIARTVRCTDCNHTGTIALPQSKLGAKLRCSRCGKRSGVIDG